MPRHVEEQRGVETRQVVFEAFRDHTLVQLQRVQADMGAHTVGQLQMTKTPRFLALRTRQCRRAKTCSHAEEFAPFGVLAPHHHKFEDGTCQLAQPATFIGL